MSLVSDEGRLVATALYHYLPWGFRATPQPEGVKRKHLIFGGCSFTYGLHVNDDETTAARLATVLPEWQVLNLGREGGSMAEPYFLFTQHDLKKLELPEAGVMIFQLVGFHQERIIPTWRVLSWIYDMAPLYSLENGKLVLKGKVGDTFAKRWAKRIQSLKLEYWWLRLVHVWDNYETKAAEEKYLAMIVGLRDAYLRQFPKGRFVVVPFLGLGLSNLTTSEEFAKKLTARGIEVSLSTHVDEGLEDKVPGDGHPNAVGHYLQARMLAKNLAHIFGKTSELKAAR